MSDTWETLNEELTTCRKCGRLTNWREQKAREKRRAYRDWDYWGKPVPGFGDRHGRLWVVGLAPGAHGSNRTGRQFTGDSSGDTLYGAMYRTGFASQPISRHRGDGLTLIDTFVTAIARCAPPQNRPTAAELNTCRPYMHRELDLMPQVQVIVALGGMAFNGCLKLLREREYELPRLKFAHGAHHPLQRPTLEGPRHLLAAYHPSRQNTQTGRLTPEMLDTVFGKARLLLGGG